MVADVDDEEEDEEEIVSIVLVLGSSVIQLRIIGGRLGDDK